ncbi:MAG: hypothetical protein ACRD2Z_05170 [Thermoanaerobaculia bacterium]
MSARESDEKAAGSIRIPAQIEEHRRQFRARLLENPNYFGNLKISGFEPQVELVGNTTYEEIGCVGFQPQINRLEAVVYVNQPSGYGGDICSAGTPEYVRFYLSFDGGATWEDQGVTSFTAYDIPQGTAGSKRLEYAVAIEVSPSKKWCGVDNVVLARAILSWNFEPPANQPDFPPVWGNVHDTRILVDPFKLKIPIDVLFSAVDLQLTPQLSKIVDPAQELALAKPKALSLSELAERYRGKVEPHRFALAEARRLLVEPGLSDEVVAAGPAALFGGLDIDISDLLGKLQPTDGNTSYEELECVGLDNERDELVAVIRIKKPLGYSGDPCSDGSREYVTFWADFNSNGTFETCLGTAQVKVYDIGALPDEGLEYALQLPVNLHPYRKQCEEGPRLVPIRAILSWQVPPPCSNPSYVPVWGNREETLVHIRPGQVVQPGDYTPFLYSLCNRDICSIDQVSGWTTGDKPFGGFINIQGEIPAAMALSVADTLKYKIWVRALFDDGTPKGFWQPLANPFTVTIQEGTGPATAISKPLPQAVDPADGYYTYREYGTPPGSWRRVISPNRQLAQWNTTVAETGLWEIMIRAKDAASNIYIAGVTTCVVDGSTRQNVKVRLDQTRPVADIAITGFSRGGGPVQPAADCATFQVGDVIHGTYTATDAPDDHFRVLTLELQPADAANGVTPTPLVRSYPTVPGAGESGSWTLDTAGADPCGYTVRLLVRDRTIVSCSDYGWWDDDFVGFCLVAPSP